MSNDTKNISPESAALHIKEMQKTMGWQILIRYFAEEREAILTEGKKSRREEKVIKMWSVLDGLDRAIGLPERIINAASKYESVSVEED